MKSRHAQPMILDPNKRTSDGTATLWCPDEHTPDPDDPCYPLALRATNFKDNALGKAKLPKMAKTKLTVLVRLPNGKTKSVKLTPVKQTQREPKNIAENIPMEINLDHWLYDAEIEL